MAVHFRQLEAAKRRSAERETWRADGTPPAVLSLDDPRAVDPAVAGAKAANLARAADAGLPVLPGFVLTTAARPVDLTVAQGTRLSAAVEDDLRTPWALLSSNGTDTLVVRSSSTVEDAGESSMAGQFTSVLGVVGWNAFLDAVLAVLASAGGRLGGDAAPMAVLVQPQLDAAAGGVLFGVDPVSGSTRHLIVAAVPSGPDALVSGTVDGVDYVLSRRGRLIDTDDKAATPLLDRRRRRQLAALAAGAADAFGGPQDIEWAFDSYGLPWLLQSRPVTATGAVPEAGAALLGPGPVAETFPDPLAPLEIDLWVEPLRLGVLEAVRLSGTVTSKRLAASPIVTTVGGRVAADLEVLGVAEKKRSFIAKLDPRPPARRLAAAWRVGRVQAALPLIIDDVLARVDADLAAVPSLAALDDVELTGLLERARRELVVLHGYEVLAGMMLPADETAPSAAGLALDALSAGRSIGLDDDTVLAMAPVTLALAPPRLGGRDPLPPLPERRPGAATVEDLPGREALRLRARWVHELMARAADELAFRLTGTGRLPDPDAARWLRLSELAAVVAGEPVPADLHQRVVAPAPPLPAAFRVNAQGGVVPDRIPGRTDGAGKGAGGGRGEGTVRHEVDPAVGAAGDVLVVATLEPGLAVALPGLAGIVSETGSVLSHLAILARELGVPTVVGVPDALRRFPLGTRLVVDGTTGEVEVVAEAPAPAAADSDEAVR